MNRYPLWKYLLVLATLVIGFIYTLPNFFGEVPAVQARDVPSPALSSAVLERKADAGITFTGSHNPPEYKGLKIYTRDGMGAPSRFTDRVEEHFLALADAWDDVWLPRAELVGAHDPRPYYLERLQGLIDWETIRSSGITMVVDPLFGATREYLDHILLENEVPITVIHNTRDPYFGGYAPDCTSENLSRLRDTMRRTGAQLGLATDGDGDRFGSLDQGARMLDSCAVLGLVLDYLARRRGMRGRVGRTLATSRLLDAVTAEHGLELMDDEAVRALVTAASAKGFQVNEHAIGDQAVRRALDAYERYGGPDLRARRFRVEHASVVDPADLPRFARLGVLASMI